MTKDEFGSLMDYMTATWPRHQLTPEQVAAWGLRVQSFDARDARAAVDALALTDEFFPSIARFVETCQCAARARMAEEGPRQLEEDTGPPLPRQEQAEHARAAVEAMRRTLAAQRNKEKKK